MGVVTNLLSTAPTGFWPNIINFFSNLVGNYAFGIILLTLAIKIIMLPIDFFNRKSMLKNAEITNKLQPEMDRIKTVYKDQQVQNAKIKELYDKNKVNPMGMCGPMLICLLLSVVIFFTLFSGLNSMANYKIVNQYETLQTSYISVISDYDSQIQAIYNDETKSEEEKDSAKNELIYSWVTTINENAELKAEAQKRVDEKYKEVKDSFLWIKNVWVSDTPWSKAVPDFNSYAKLAKLNNTETEREENKIVYNSVMSSISDSESVNGYLILTVLTAVATMAAQYLSSKANKKKTDQVQQSTNKLTMIIFPIIMGLFTLLYNAVFSIYILVGQIFTIATTPLITKIINVIDKKKAQKESENSNRMKRI